MNALASHYQQQNLDDHIRHALEIAIRDQKGFDPNIIAAVDQFHIGGLQATNDMLALANFSPDDRVLDIGCGIGGPARNIAQHCETRVIGLDLSFDYCMAAEIISSQLKMSQQTGFVQANAVHLPFADNSFSGIWTQHVTMNIEHKDLLIGEFSCILKPAGKLVMYEVTGQPNMTNSIQYPLPWSVDGSYSFLQNDVTYRELIQSNGLRINHFENVTSKALNSVTRLLNRLQKNKIQKPNLGLLLGEHYPTMMANLAQGLEDQSLSVYQIVARKTNGQD